MKPFRSRGAGAVPIIAFILLAVASGAYANSIGQASTSPGAAFAGACAGNEAFGGVPDPGSIYNPPSQNFGDGVSYYACNYGYSNVGGAVSANASNSGTFTGGNAWSNQSNSTAAPQQIHLSGTNNASTLTEFSGATANGGWNDNYTLQITDPSVVLTTPVSGYWIVPINVDGSLSVNNSFSVAELGVAAYENNSELNQFTTGGASAYSFFTANNTVDNGDIESSSDLMQVEYGVGGGGSLLSLNVNDTIFFALPVTFDSNTDTIDAGIYAQIWLTQSYGDGPATSETAAFQNTIGWGGPGQLVLGGTTYQSNQFSVTGTSGADYEAPFSETPEPSAVTTLAIGLCVLLGLRWRGARTKNPALTGRA